MHSVFRPLHARPMTADAPMLPAKADVVIIGGGISGCAAAYYLAKRRRRVVLLERGTIACEQSSRAWGFIRKQGRHPAEVPLAIEALRIWDTLSSELDADLEFVRQGILAPAISELDEANALTSARVASEHGLSTRVLSARELKALIPQMSGEWRAALYTPDDGHGEPIKATRAFARAAASCGATILENTGVTRIDTSNGNVDAVHTVRGVVKAETVVCAAGLGTAAILRRVGLSLPIHAVRVSVAESEPTKAFTQLAVWTPGVAFRPTGRGTFYIGGGYRGRSADLDLTIDGIRYFRQFLPQMRNNPGALAIHVGRPLLRSLWRGVDPLPQAEPRVNDALVNVNVERFRKLFPQLRELGIKRRWAGLIDSTPDLIPVLGPLPDLPSLIVAGGFSGHGFALGPITGRILSDLVTRGTTALDIRPFRVTRFAERDLQIAPHAY